MRLNRQKFANVDAATEIAFSYEHLCDKLNYGPDANGLFLLSMSAAFSFRSPSGFGPPHAQSSNSTV